MTPLIVPAILVGALGAWLLLRLVRATQMRRVSRARYFDALKSIFDGGEIRIQPTGFPRMTGQHEGLAFDLQVVPDTLTFRKLPALWVLLTLPEALPVGATADFLARPAGNETFTHFDRLSQTMAAPEGFPADLAVRSDDATQLPPTDLLARQASLFHDPKIKELVISPKGLRIVILAEEADRGRFLIFREAEMGRSPLDPAIIHPLIKRLAALRSEILAEKAET